MIDVIAQDVLFTWYIVLSAKKYLRVPNVVNYYRVRQNSLFHKKEDVPTIIGMRVHAVVEGFKCFNNFLSRIDFFNNHPNLKYMALEHWIQICCNYLQSIYAQIPSWELDELIRRELNEVNDQTALTAFIFARMNVFNVRLNRQQKLILEQQKIIRQLQAQLQKFV